jgi:hypothetical protein
MRNWPGWQVAGVTSLAAPRITAMANASSKMTGPMSSELATIYSHRTGNNKIRDVVLMYGMAGGNRGTGGYDSVTGASPPANITSITKGKLAEE